MHSKCMHAVMVIVRAYSGVCVKSWCVPAFIVCASLEYCVHGMLEYSVNCVLLSDHVCMHSAIVFAVKE